MELNLNQVIRHAFLRRSKIHTHPRSRRSWLPNVVKYKFYSQLLESEIKTHVTTKALKCIRKFNGFDNYILMTKAKKLDSLYGEYLRKLMLKKLNDPSFVVLIV